MLYFVFPWIGIIIMGHAKTWNHPERSKQGRNHHHIQTDIYMVTYLFLYLRSFPNLLFVNLIDIFKFRLFKLFNDFKDSLIYIIYCESI